MNCLTFSLQDCAAVAQILQLVVVVIALVYAGFQVKEAVVANREAVMARKAQAFKDVLEEISEDEVRKARRWVIITDIPEKLSRVNILKELEEEELQHQKDMRRVAVAYDRVGFYLKNGLLPGREFYEWQGSEIKILWGKLKDIVNNVQSQSGERRPDYCKNFEYLGTKWIKKMEQMKKISS